MAGLVGGVDALIRLGQAAVGLEGGVMQQDLVGLGMGVDIGGARARGRFGHDDGDAALGADHILHEKSRLAHHRPPAGLVPADRAVLEEDLELAVVVHAGLHILGQPRPHAMDAQGPGPGDLAHDIDIVDAAIDEGREAGEQALMGLPFGPAALLVQIHPEDQRAAQLAGELDEADPGGVVAQDIADDELAAGAPGRRHHPLGIGDRIGDRLLEEDVRSCFHRLDGEIRMGIRQGIDGDDIGLEGGQRRRKIGEAGGLGQGRRKLPARDAALAEADHLETGDSRIGQGMGEAHAAETDHQDPLLFHSVTPASMPAATIACRRFCDNRRFRDKAAALTTSPAVFRPIDIQGTCYPNPDLDFPPDSRPWPNAIPPSPSPATPSIPICPGPAPGARRRRRRAMTR